MVALQNLHELAVEAEQEYRQLAEQLARGAEVPRTKIADVLGDSGRNVEQLKADAQRIVARMAMVDELARAEALTAEIHQSQRHIEEAKRELAEIQAKYEADRAGPSKRLHQAEQAYRLASDDQSGTIRLATKQLVDTADPAIARELERLVRERCNAEALLPAVRKQRPPLAAKVEALHGARKEAAALKGREHDPQARFRLEDLNKVINENRPAEFELKMLDEGIAGHEKTLADVLPKIAALEAKQRDPAGGIALAAVDNRAAKPARERTLDDENIFAGTPAGF